LQHKISMAQKCNVIERAQDLRSPNQWPFTVDEAIVIHNFAVAAPRFNSSRAVMARKARRRSLLECPWCLVDVVVANEYLQETFAFVFK
jgi:hypothetical protein